MGFRYQCGYCSKMHNSTFDNVKCERKQRKVERKAKAALRSLNVMSRGRCFVMVVVHKECGRFLDKEGRCSKHGYIEVGSDPEIPEEK